MIHKPKEVKLWLVVVRVSQASEPNITLVTLRLEPNERTLSLTVLVLVCAHIYSLFHKYAYIIIFTFIIILYILLYLGAGIRF